MVVDRTPTKKRIHSPCGNNEDEKQTTSNRYKTKTPRGSIIHSNFKINKNSLPKNCGSTAEKRGPTTEERSQYGMQYSRHISAVKKQLDFG